MKNAKLILTVLAVLIAAVLTWVVVGLVVTVVKFLLVAGLALVVGYAVLKLYRKAAPPELGEGDAGRELEQGTRRMEESGRRQLIK